MSDDKKVEEQYRILRKFIEKDEIDKFIKYMEDHTNDLKYGNYIRPTMAIIRDDSHVVNFVKKFRSSLD